MRIVTASLLASVLLATPALALDARTSRHLEHLAHAGLGKRLDAAAVRRLPHAYVVAREPSTGTKAAVRKHRKVSDKLSAERAGYKRVSELTKGAFPNFYPGLGEVLVRPATLPLGPFLTFDHKGHQVSTVYMPSLEDMNGHKKFDVGGTREPRVDHVTIYYHGGHPGVDYPHYHYVLWHVTKKGESRVAK